MPAAARALRRLTRSEDGFTLIEVVVALTLLSFASAAFAVTTGHGFRLVGTSQERQTAMQVANEWMEQARVIPYEGLALPSSISWGGAGTPDENVSGTTYIGEAGTEELVLESGSTLEHVIYESVNNIDYEAYRYVTWVEDGAIDEAYKRIIVVVQWNGTSTDGAPQRVELASIVSADSIGWTSTTSTSSTSTSTTTTTSSTTTTTVAGGCDGDATAPTGTMAILAGSGAQAGYTSSSTVTLSLTASDPCGPLQMAFSNDGSTFSAWEAFETNAVWTLAAGNGSRTMWVRYSDGVGNSLTLSSSVIVDATKPSTPSGFVAEVKHSPLRVELKWNQSTDNDAVIGYRIYVAQGSGSFQNQSTGVSHPCPTTPCGWTHTGVRKKDTYTYYVVSYDSAGNESEHPTHLTRTI